MEFVIKKPVITMGERRVSMPSGWAIVWGPGVFPQPMTTVAYRSPLTGAWLVDTGDAVRTSSVRVRSLREARKIACAGGNGRRYRGHTSIDHVVTV